MKAFFGRRRWAQVFVGLSALLVFGACSKTEEKKGAGNGSGEMEARHLRVEYNALADQYNSAVKDSYSVSQATRESGAYLFELDQALNELAERIEILDHKFTEYVNGLETLDAQLRKKTDKEYGDALNAVTDSRSKCFDIVSSLEASLIKTLASLHENAANAYAKPEEVREKLEAQRKGFSARGNTLSGMRRLILNSVQEVLTRYGLVLHERKEKGLIQHLPSVVTQASEKEIELDVKEQKIGALNSASSAVVSDTQGQTKLLNGKDEVLNYAETHGFDIEAAYDALEIAKSSGSIVGFAENSAQLGNAIQNMIAHVKNTMNQNNGDLELVFALDYSGSMSDDIQSVIANLAEITKALEAVHKSGRTVKLGIISFGEPKREKVELELTSNFVSVQTALARLFDEYHLKQHSTDPGEASYHGLQIALEGISWSSQNKTILLITDEPAHELRVSDFENSAIVRNVNQKLKSSVTGVVIYPIVVTQ
ncbi:MAG: VWA domain-containing protein [Bdellovibrionota bacterium]